MRSHTAVLSTLVTLVLALAGVALVVAAPASAAGTSYVWRGLGDIESWGDSRNWLPTGVPGDGDSVSIEAYNDNICHAHVTGVPAGLQLTDLTVDEHLYLGSADSPCLTSLDGGSITVTHAFTFHAGTIATPVTIAAGATGTVTPGAAHDTTHFTGPVTVDGTLTLTGNTDPEDLSLTASPGVTVDAGGTLVTTGDNDVSANCCSTPAHLVNHGSIQLGADTLDLAGVELDQDALLHATGGGQVVSTTAPQTAGAGAKWTGTGSWLLGRSSSTTVSGTQTLGGQFRWVLGGHGSTSEEYLQGTFALAGGRFEWDGGVIGAAMTVGASTTFVADGVDGPDGRQLDGRDSAGSKLTLTNKGNLTVSGGAGWHGVDGGRLTNTSSGSVTLGSGTVLTADGSQSAVVNSGGLVTIPAGAGTVALSNTGYRGTGGTLAVGVGSDLDVSGGSGSLSATTITGGGSVGIAEPVALAGTTTVDSDTTVTLRDHGSLTAATGAPATLGGAGSFTWAGGALAGPVTVATAGGQTVAGSDPVHQVGGGKSSAVTFAGPTTVQGGTADSPVRIEGAKGSKLAFTGDLTVTGGLDVVGAGVTTSATTTVTAGSVLDVDRSLSSSGTTVLELSGTARGTVTVGGAATVAGVLRLVDLGSYQPSTGDTAVVLTAGSLTLHLTCTTTTGAGASAQHWVAKAVSGRQLRLTSKAGAATSC